jgi:hypothetical protein
VVGSGLGLEMGVGGRLWVGIEVWSGSVTRWVSWYGEGVGGRVGARSRDCGRGSARGRSRGWVGVSLEVGVGVRRMVWWSGRGSVSRWVSVYP